MSTGFSKMLLREPLTVSNDIQSYITHFDLLAHLQKWRRTEMHDRNEVEIDERPHFLALPLQQSANSFYSTLTEAQKASYDETFRALRNQSWSVDVLQDEFNIEGKN